MTETLPRSNWQKKNFSNSVGNFSNIKKNLLKTDQGTTVLE